MGYPHFRKLHIMLILYIYIIYIHICGVHIYIYIVEYIRDMGISHGTSQNYSGFLSRSMTAVAGNKFPAEKNKTTPGEWIFWGIVFGTWK